MTPARRTKGHWPKGKPRNVWTSGDWPNVRQRLRDLIRNYPRPGQRSGNELGRQLGVDPATSNAWLRGTDNPPESLRPAMLEWIENQRKIIKRG